MRLMVRTAMMALAVALTTPVTTAIIATSNKVFLAEIMSASNSHRV